jgi:hypothetical protein
MAMTSEDTAHDSRIKRYGGNIWFQLKIGIQGKNKEKKIRNECQEKFGVRRGWSSF